MATNTRHPGPLWLTTRRLSYSARSLSMSRTCFALLIVVPRYGKAQEDAEKLAKQAAAEEARLQGLMGTYNVVRSPLLRQDRIFLWLSVFLAVLSSSPSFA
jgi:hypothetical protein